MTLRETIMTQIAHVAEEQHKPLGPLTDDLQLFESGLDSLCLAIVVARLEEECGLDPFASDSEFEFPQTVGDFIALYEKAAAATVHETVAA